jgi:hypothetical protein
LQEILQAFNSTFPTLIPKEGKANSPNKFRPISLCNVIYKIIYKVINNRIKFIISCITSHEQGGYIKGHQILDGIIISHEAIHSLKSNKKLDMLIKHDMSKSFDGLNGDFLVQMLLDFGFSWYWVNTVKNLVSLALFVLVNGSPAPPPPIQPIYWHQRRISLVSISIYSHDGGVGLVEFFLMEFLL